MASWSIGELAKQAGVQPSAVRYYESLGLISPPERAGGKRRYGSDCLLRLNAIQLFKQAGFTMAELQVLFQREPLPDQAALDDLTDRKLRELDELVARIEVTKAVLSSIRRCGCLTVEECAVLVSQGG